VNETVIWKYSSLKTKIDTLVLKLSGSLFFSENLQSVVKAIKDALSERLELKVVLIAGGGAKAREYIKIASGWDADQATQDEIGIMVSRINAMILAVSLGEFSQARVPETLGALVDALRGARAIAMGGLHPGQSTNAVGALVAEKVHALRFINATDVDGVHTKDPRKFKDAKVIDRLTTRELEKIMGEESMHAGAYDLMDPVALKLVERSKTDTWIIKCTPKTIGAALLGKRVGGTEIVFS
jgi:uridylate kinase